MPFVRRCNRPAGRSRAEILSGDDSARAFELLVDTGADQTVISLNILQSWNVEMTSPQERIGGVGRLVDSVTVNRQIRLSRGGW